MAVTPIGQLAWVYLTQLLLDIKSPNTFLQSLLYSNHHTNNVESIQMDSIVNSRKIAPFVERDAEAIMVDGVSAGTQTVTAPNIRIKKPFTPSPLLYGRMPGTPVFTNGFNVAQAARAHIARDVQGLGDMITNAQEWLVAQSLQGVISYSTVGQAIFTITFPRSGSRNITLSTFWDAGSGYDVEGDIHRVKRLQAEEGFDVTDAICGTEVSDRIRFLASQGLLKSLDQRLVSGSVISLAEKYRADGAIFIGTFAGINFWEYPRQATLNGVAQNMIRPKYIEFIGSNGAAGRVMEYGSIPDFDAMEGSGIESERFGKSWLEKDPSVFWVLAHSRPLPVPRRPNATVSMKAISG